MWYHTGNKVETKINRNNCRQLEGLLKKGIIKSSRLRRGQVNERVKTTSLRPALLHFSPVTNTHGS